MNRFGVAAFAAVLVSVATVKAGVQYTSMVVFGDSLSDTGTTLRYTTLMNQATFGIAAVRPTGPNYATGRWTNGANVGYAGLNLAPSNSSTIWHWSMADALNMQANARAQNVYTGVQNRNNYAAGAAVTGAGQQTLTVPFVGTFTSSDNVGHQVNTLFLGTAPTMSATTVYAFMAGGNDIRDAVRAGANVDTAKNVAKTAAQNMGGYIQSLAQRAQNQNVKITVAWANVVPMQLIPDFANAYGGNAGWRTSADEASKAFRAEWTLQMNTLRTNFANHLDLKGIDFWQLFMDVNAGNVAAFAGMNQNDPIFRFNAFSGVGFNPAPTRNPILPVAGELHNPDNYLFWDQVHPTSRVHELMGLYAAAQIPAPGAGVVVVMVMTWGLGARRRRVGARIASKRNGVATPGPGMRAMNV